MKNIPKDGSSILIYALGSWSIASWNGRGYWNLEVDCVTLAYDSNGEIIKRQDEDVKSWMFIPDNPLLN